MVLGNFWPGEVIELMQSLYSEVMLLKRKSSRESLGEEVTIKGISMLVELVQENSDGTFSIKAKRKS